MQTFIGMNEIYIHGDTEGEVNYLMSLVGKPVCIQKDSDFRVAICRCVAPQNNSEAVEQPLTQVKTTAAPTPQGEITRAINEQRDGPRFMDITNANTFPRGFIG